MGIVYLYMYYICFYFRYFLVSLFNCMRMILCYLICILPIFIYVQASHEPYGTQVATWAIAPNDFYSLLISGSRLEVVFSFLGGNHNSVAHLMQVILMVARHTIYMVDIGDRYLLKKVYDTLWSNEDMLELPTKWGNSCPKKTIDHVWSALCLSWACVTRACKQACMHVYCAHLDSALILMHNTWMLT